MTTKAGHFEDADVPHGCPTCDGVWRNNQRTKESRIDLMFDDPEAEEALDMADESCDECDADHAGMAP